MIFGYQNNQDQTDDTQDDTQMPGSVVTSTTSGQSTPTSDDASQAVSPTDEDAVNSAIDAIAADPLADQPTTYGQTDDAVGLSDDMSSSDDYVTNLAGESEESAEEPTLETNESMQPTSQDAAVPDELLALKQQALGELSPLVDHLEQTPEEKFRTTMMLIQSTDNQALLKEAYAAAQAISDDKMRAQALLDVVNEINYFTQQKHDA